LGDALVQPVDGRRHFAARRGRAGRRLSPDDPADDDQTGRDHDRDDDQA
jgi:hypothetical protein